MTTGVVIKHRGNFKKTETFLKKASDLNIQKVLEKYGQKGVAALSAATPVDTGLTAQSWSYEIKKNKGSITLSWTNSNMVNGVPIVILLQYGHGTKNGGFVQGTDFINPVMKQVFDDITKEVWVEVTRL